MKNKRKKHYLGLDLLRFMAALLVLISHVIISNNVISDGIKTHAYIVSSMAVEIFFCLSGFLICKQGLDVLKNKKYITYNTFCFITRRIMRTWPAYFFILLFYAIFYKKISLEIAPYIFFVQNLYYPIVIENFFEVSWSITVEELFYFIFPILLVLFCYIINFNFKKYKKTYLILSVCIFIILILLIIKTFITFESWGSEVRRVAIFRLDAIALGGVSYFFFIRCKNIRYFNLFNLIFFIIFCLISYFLLMLISNSQININPLFYNMTLLSLSIGGVTLVIVFANIIETRKQEFKKVILFLANVSYPIYLIHTIIIDLINKTGINNLSLQLVIIIFTSLVVSVSIRFLIEEPILTRRPKYKQ